MRIGIDIRNVGKKRTGDEAVFFNLTKNLAKIDGRNEYWLFTDISEEKTVEKIKNDLGIRNKANFEVIPLVAGWPLRNKFGWNIWTLPRYLRKNPVDIYHTQYITPFFVTKRIKIITTIHDISFNFFPQFIRVIDLIFLKLLIPVSLRRADKIIAVSRFTRDEIIKYYNVIPEKIECVYNAVADIFAESNFSSIQLGEVRKKYDLPEKFIFYIGTMQPRKNLSLLVEAFGKAKEKISDLKLVLAGGKNAYNFDKKIGKLIHKFSLSEDVIFPGFVPEEEKKAFFRLAEAFCSPSLYEGFDIPILEAFATGIPVIASEIPVHREIAGDSALFFAASNSSELAEKIGNICTDEGFRNLLISKGKNQSEKFSWKDSAEKTLAIYEKMGI
ncbi:MAG TPA: glycosyltransferase family 1 protein [Patescibacteria group bacterium]